MEIFPYSLSETADLLKFKIKIKALLSFTIYKHDSQVSNPGPLGNFSVVAAIRSCPSQLYFEVAVIRVCPKLCSGCSDQGMFESTVL